MMGYCVYIHKSPSNKVYVGVTTQKPEDRWDAGRGYKNNEYFFRAITKYGWENFTHTLICVDTRDEMLQLEQELIVSYMSTNPEYGYNITTGGEHFNHSEASKLKMSEVYKERYVKENHPNFGKHLSEETRKKISDSHKGVKASEETRRKMSECRRGKDNPFYGSKLLSGERNGMYGCHHTDEAKRKMSEFRKGKKFGPRSEEFKKKVRKPIIQYSLEGEYVREWTCAKEASLMLDIPSSSITHCCKGGYKTSHGFIWKYKDS